MPSICKTVVLLVGLTMGSVTGCSEDPVASNHDACDSASGALQAIGNLMDTRITAERMPLLQRAGDRIEAAVPSASDSVATTRSALVTAIREAETGAVFSRWPRLLDVFSACEIA